MFRSGAFSDIVQKSASLLSCYSSMQANQAHPRPQTPDPVLTQMYWTQLNKAIRRYGRLFLKGCEPKTELLLEPWPLWFRHRVAL